MESNWQIWIDTGGTFTDCLAQSPAGEVQRIKVLSSGHLRGSILDQPFPNTLSVRHSWPDDQDLFKGYFLEVPGQDTPLSVVEYDPEKKWLILEKPTETNFSGLDFSLTANEEAPILAARLTTRTRLDCPLPPITMRLGSTKGTNALLERKGARTCLLITEGFKDLIYIGTQQRPHLFQLNIPEPEVLYNCVLEVPERISAQGDILTPLPPSFIIDVVRFIQEGRYQSVAIALLHAYHNPIHELQLQRALKKAGIRFISTSHELSPTIKLLPRARTTLVNAYLSPLIEEYLSNIALAIGADKGRGTLLVMTSAGGLMPYDAYQPKDSLLSGPAGGVVGAATIGQSIGISRILTLDMGGTSTDTARYDRGYDYQFYTNIDGIEMNSPALAIETVAAGGGSVCWFDGQQLKVGPHSASANPGPAAYGAGGPLTITDVNLLLGKMLPDHMSIPLRPERAQLALNQLRLQVEEATGKTYSSNDILTGLEAIANEKMAEAIRKISISRGFNPSEFALLAFGGAGGLHAAQVAELLNISTLILPFDGGLLSAYGIGHARIERLAELQVLRLLDDPALDLNALIDQATKAARSKLIGEGLAENEIEIRKRLLFLRFSGQNTPLEIDFSSIEGSPADLFEASYSRLFGYLPKGRSIELESIRVIASTRERTSDLVATIPLFRTLVPTPGSHQYPVIYWPDLRAGDVFHGPALVLSDHSSFFLPKGWLVKTQNGRNLIAEKTQTNTIQNEAVKEAVELELFTNRFMSIATDMGAQLQRTAFSVNVKERLDFSCAILNPKAELLVNAPHIPVHLGSLGICARLCLESLHLESGDVILTNHPKYGGSHLPDVTMLTGAYTEEGQLIGYLINRAHHAEIGGKRPGSMPPDAIRLSEEGITFPPTYLVKNGEVQWPVIEASLMQEPYPSRSISENLADLRAALASLHYGAHALKKLVTSHGLGKVHKYMSLLQRKAANVLEEGISPFLGKVYQAIESLDDGHQLAVRIDFRQKPYTFDFSGTSPAHPFNLNANLSIVYSAVLYVLRLLCAAQVPLNEGLMQAIAINLPKSSLLHPDFSDDPEACPAVVGGNTEVSQRLVDTLLKALGVAACSQGTMNNLLFGNPSFGYYETIGGGTGAGKGFHGRSGVHQHMTNTRMTDPEELEFKFPVRLWQFGLRTGSGGKGTWSGGEGIVRELEFLEEVDFTLISQHRVIPPYGLEGGQNGATGQQWHIKKNGEKHALDGIVHRVVSPGERIRIETPGGGGYGRPEP